MSINNNHNKYMIHKNRIGFIQGRLVPPVNGKIQAFPKTSWQQEFSLSKSIGLKCMEWTLDQEGLMDNPLLTEQGQKEIRELCDRYDMTIHSVTGDFFMQAPFYKVAGAERRLRINEMLAVLQACSNQNICFLCMPLVDNGRIENREQEQHLFDVLSEMTPFLIAHGLNIIFESDKAPVDYARFLEKLDHGCFGVNLDTGNSAAFGYAIEDEMKHYGTRVKNVHIKDRLYKGGTVPLGAGDAELSESIMALESSGYTGKYILQTARANDGEHVNAIERYAEMTFEWINAAHRKGVV